MGCQTSAAAPAPDGHTEGGETKPKKHHGIIPTKGRLAARKQNCKAKLVPPLCEPAPRVHEPDVDHSAEQAHQAPLGLTLLANPLAHDQPSKDVQPDPLVATNLELDPQVSAVSVACQDQGHQNSAALRSTVDESTWTLPQRQQENDQPVGEEDAALTPPGVAEPAVKQSGSELSKNLAQVEEAEAALSNMLELRKQKLAEVEAEHLSSMKAEKQKLAEVEAEVSNLLAPLNGDAGFAPGVSNSPANARGEFVEASTACRGTKATVDAPCGSQTCAAMSAACVGGAQKAKVQLPFGIVSPCCPAARQNSIDELCFCGSKAFDDRPVGAASKPSREDDRHEEVICNVKAAQAELLAVGKV